LAGALLEKAESLIDDDIHPVIIAEGYKKASKKAMEFLTEITINVKPKDKEILEKIANTSMQTKLVSIEATDLAKLAVNAVLAVIEEKNGTSKVNLDNIKIEKKTGGSISDSELVSGIILDKEIVHSGMPRRVENAKIGI